MRFERQLPIFCEEGQQRIMSSVVGVVGCGAVGINVITQLTMAGVTHFILCDHKSPELHNLNSQFIYSAHDYRSKAVISAEWILALNPSAEVQANSEPLTKDNGDLFMGCSILIDCLDNDESRDAPSDLAEMMEIPLIHASVNGLEGQIAVAIPGERTMKEILPKGCDDSSAVGSAASLVASMASLEALKIMSGIGTENSGCMIKVDMTGWNIAKG